MAAPLLLTAVVNQPGTIIALTFDQDMEDPVGNGPFFSVSQDGSTNQIAYPVVYADDDDPAVFQLVLAEPIREGAVVTLSYAGGTVAAATTELLADITGFAVTNGASAPNTGDVLWDMSARTWPPSGFIPTY